MKLAVLPLSSWQAVHILASVRLANSLCSGSRDLFLSGCLHRHYFPSFFLPSLSLSFTAARPPSSQPASWCQVLFQDIFRSKEESGLDYWCSSSWSPLGCCQRCVKWQGNTGSKRSSFLSYNTQIRWVSTSKCTLNANFQSADRSSVPLMS